MSCPDCFRGGFSKSHPTGNEVTIHGLKTYVAEPEEAAVTPKGIIVAEVPPSSFWPPADADSLLKNAIGYAASKWMGEILLERGTVFRLLCTASPTSWGPMRPKRFPGELDTIDVSDVVPEFLAKAYAHDPREPFAVHNYCSENRYLLSDLAGMYNARLGTKVNILPTREWMQKAKALGMPAGVEATWTGNAVFVSPVLRKGAKL